jgi:hypothetical protein
MQRFCDRRVIAPLVPEGFLPSAGLVTDAFLLEPFGPEHNERSLHAHLDAELRREVAAWLAVAWPFVAPAYASGS